MRHPSGPNLPGHPQCGPGMIYDHQSMRCISLMAHKKKKGSSRKKFIVEGVR